MPRLSIAFLFYGRFTDRFVVAKQTMKQTTEQETDCTTLLSLETQDVEGRQLQYV